MTTLDHIGLSVGDLEAQIEWYTRALGLELRDRGGIEAINMRVAFLVEPDEGWSIELLERQGSVPGLQAPDAPTAVLTRGWGHICLRVADVRETYDALIAAGATSRMEPSESPTPGLMLAFVADPEGNLIEMLDRPGIPGTPTAKQRAS